MKKFLASIYIIVAVLFFVAPKNAQAQNVSADPCSSWNVSVISGLNGIDASFVSGSKSSHTITLNASALDPNEEYFIGTYDSIWFAGGAHDWIEGLGSGKQPSGGQLKYTLTQDESLKTFGDDDEVYAFLGTGNFFTGDVCYLGNYTITTSTPSCDDIFVSQNRDGNQCFSSGCIEKGTINIQVTGIKNQDGSDYTGAIEVKIIKDGLSLPDQDKNQTPVNGVVNTTHSVNESGSYSVIAQLASGGNLDCPQPSFNVEAFLCDDANDPKQCGGQASALAGETTTPFQLCAQINDPSQYNSCVSCAGGAEGVAAGVWTAVGCIPTNATSIVQSLIKIGLSVAGGVALLMILASGFIYSTSQGDPKRTNEAKELMTSAVIGLLFIIFSVTMLQFIGVNVLRLPGFGTP